MFEHGVRGFEGRFEVDRRRQFSFVIDVSRVLQRVRKGHSRRFHGFVVIIHVQKRSGGVFLLSLGFFLLGERFVLQRVLLKLRAQVVDLQHDAFLDQRSVVNGTAHVRFALDNIRRTSQIYGWNLRRRS